MTIVWVSPESSLEILGEAVRAAKVAQSQMPYDQIPYLTHDPIVKRHIHALIAKEDEACVGFAVVEMFPMIARIQWEEISCEFQGVFEKHAHWTVSCLWVDEAHRREGIATRMIESIADHFSVATESLSFLAPFTGDATALLKAMLPKEIYVTFQQ